MRGNDDPHPALSRKRERENGTLGKDPGWIPAFAGMTAVCAAMTAACAGMTP